MGRVKLKIKRLESSSNRLVTYSKRRSGIVKKAKELSILCDIDIVLLMFSPTGKPTLFHGERSNIEEVITKFAQLTPQERAKRKLEGLEALKKTFKKLDHDVNIQDFVGSSAQTVEDMANQVRLLQGQITEVEKRLSYWNNPDKIDNIEHLRQMEDLLKESVNYIRQHKDNLGKQQIASMERTNQLENGMPSSYVMGGMQEAQPLSWLPINESHPMFTNEPHFLSHSAIEGSADASVPGCSTYFCGDAKTDMGNLTQIVNLAQEGCVLNGLNRSACLSLQVNEQFPYNPYGGLNFSEEKKLKNEMEINVPGHHVGYHLPGNVELSRPIYENGHHSWAPAPAACGMAMYGGTYNQQPN